MSKRYHFAPRSATLGHCRSVPVITNDLFLASFLHCLGCTLDSVERNDRHRVSFVFSGERVKELREAYRSGSVSLDIKAFRESMHLMRSRMDMTLSTLSSGASYYPNQRSLCYARTTTTPSPQH